MNGNYTISMIEVCNPIQIKKLFYVCLTEPSYLPREELCLCVWGGGGRREGASPGKSGTGSCPRFALCQLGSQNVSGPRCLNQPP